MKWSYGWQDIHQRFSACLQIGVSWEFCKTLVPSPHPPAQISIGLVWVGPGLNQGAPVTPMCYQGESHSAWCKCSSRISFLMSSVS